MQLSKASSPITQAVTCFQCGALGIPWVGGGKGLWVCLSNRGDRKTFPMYEKCTWTPRPQRDEGVADRFRARTPNHANQAAMAMFLALFQWYGPGAQGRQKLGYESWDHLLISHSTNFYICGLNRSNTCAYSSGSHKPQLCFMEPKSRR